MNIRTAILCAFLALFCASFVASAEPVVDFSHRYAKFNITMKLSRVKRLEKYLPNKLRREIGDEYYPQIRQKLSQQDTMHFKTGEFQLYNEEDGKIKLQMTFPVFYLTIRDLTWDDLDQVYEKYFAPGTGNGKKEAPLPKRFPTKSALEQEYLQ